MEEELAPYAEKFRSTYKTLSDAFIDFSLAFHALNDKLTELEEAQPSLFAPKQRNPNA